jgi:hypothetical protein
LQQYAYWFLCSKGWNYLGTLFDWIILGTHLHMFGYIDQNSHIQVAIIELINMVIKAKGVRWRKLYSSHYLSQGLSFYYSHGFV